MHTKRTENLRMRRTGKLHRGVRSGLLYFFPARERLLSLAAFSLFKRHVVSVLLSPAVACKAHHGKAREGGRSGTITVALCSPCCTSENGGRRAKKRNVSGRKCCCNSSLSVIPQGRVVREGLSNQ